MNISLNTDICYFICIEFDHFTLIEMSSYCKSIFKNRSMQPDHIGVGIADGGDTWYKLLLPFPFVDAIFYLHLFCTLLSLVQYFLGTSRSMNWYHQVKSITVHSCCMSGHWYFHFNLQPLKSIPAESYCCI